MPSPRVPSTPGGSEAEKAEAASEGGEPDRRQKLGTRKQANCQNLSGGLQKWPAMMCAGFGSFLGVGLGA